MRSSCVYWVKTAAAVLAWLTSPSRYAILSVSRTSVARGIWTRSFTASLAIIACLPCTFVSRQAAACGGI